MGIGVLAPFISVWYWAKKCWTALLYSSVVSYFHSGSGLTEYWKVWYSGMDMNMERVMDKGMGMDRTWTWT
jgi:hypothetical protein